MLQVAMKEMQAMEMIDIQSSNNRWRTSEMFLGFLE